MSVLCATSSVPFATANKAELAVFTSGSTIFDSEFETSSWSSTPRDHSPESPFTSGTISFDSPISSISATASVANHDITFDLATSACEAIGSWLDFHLAEPDFGQKSPFDAHTEPKITVSAYLERIRYYSQVSPESTICGLVLLRRVCNSSGIILTNYNVHRLLVASLMVFAKFYDDDIDSNCRWARIAGIKKTEMNHLEIELLNRCQFDLRVTTQAFHDMVCELVDFSKHPHEKPSKQLTCTMSVQEPAKRTKGHIKIFRSHEAPTSHSEVERPKGLHRTKSIVSFFHHHQNPHIHFNRVVSVCDKSTTPSSGATLTRPLSVQSLTGLISPLSLFHKRSKGTKPEAVVR